MIPPLQVFAYPSDPTILSLANLPTLFTTHDVRQGAAGDTNALSALTALDGPMVPSTPLSGAGSLSAPVAAGQTLGQAFTSGVTAGYNAVTGTDGVDCSDVGVMDAITSPVASLNCVLNRALFGVLAIALIGGGAFLLFKDA